MIKKIISAQSKTVIGAAIILGSTSFISRVIGVARDRIFAHQFGAGDVLDAYYAAFRIPDFIYNLLVIGALSAGFLPVFISVWEKDKERAWQVANTVLNLLCILLIIVCAAVFIFAPELMPKIAPGFSERQTSIAIRLTRIMLASPIILGISSIVSSVLQSFKFFVIYSIAPVMYNIGIIFGAIFLVPIFGETGLAYGVIIGAALHLLVQIPTLLHSGFRYMPVLRFDYFVKLIGSHMIPRLLALAAQQIMFIAATILASTLPSGSIAIFNFANNLQYFPVGIIGISFAMAAFPTLSSLAAQKEIKRFAEQVGHTTRIILFFIIPLTVIFLILRAQIVRVVLGSGNFDWRATVETADALAFFSLSLFAQCLVLLFIRAFFALQNTKTPLLASALAMAVSIIASIILKPILGVAGLALAFSAATIVQIALLWVALHHRVGSIGEGKTLKSLCKISIAAIFMAVVIQSLKSPISTVVDMTRFWGIFSQAAMSGGAGIFIFFVICRVLKLEEMLNLEGSIARRFLKLRKIPAEVIDVEPNR